jgi:GNAT superfamily N-acetyltransferase
LPPGDEDTAWFDADAAPAAARPAHAPQAVSGSGAAPQQAPAPTVPRILPPGDEDTSWFDDAPAAPSTRPALKSSPPAKAPPPPRPAANTPASPAAASDESYAWFDDVPATPIAKPVRTPAPERIDGDEAHLLNVAVAAEWQGQGLGRFLLNQSVARARGLGMEAMLLEVRPANTRALDIYQRYGFKQIGRRKGYYPADNGQREDAIVMRIAI